MSLPSLTQLYEEVNFKTHSEFVAIAGHALDPNPRNLSYTYSHGQTPTCTFTIDNSVENPAPLYLVEDAEVQVYEGFNGTMVMVFNGTIESLSPQETGLQVQCSGEGKKLDQPYRRTVTTTNGIDSATIIVGKILDGVGVFLRYVNLGTWIPGTVVHQPLQFQTAGEAVNKIAEPFGSPWYEMPNGQIRVELRDQIPAPSPYRIYFSGNIVNGVYSQPGDITNVNAKPRIRSVQSVKLPRDVRNEVIVRGAQITQIGPRGEQNQVVLEATAFAVSPWIPPVNGIDQFVDLVITNDLLDVLADVVAVDVRYLQLYNRLNEQLNVTVEGDPQMFLGATVQIDDLRYTGLNARYFVQGYTTNRTENDFTTSLTLVGGRAAGSSPRIAPFADFTWTDQFAAVPPGVDIQRNNSNNSLKAASKVIQVVPGGAGNAQTGAGTGGQMVIITFDASMSVDPDGTIVSYSWADNVGHSGTGKRITIAYDYNGPSTAQMTLTVTDNDGLSSSLTQTVNISGTGPSDGYSTGEDNGGSVSIPTIAIAGSTYMSCTVDGGGTRNDLFVSGSGRALSVAAGTYKDTGALILYFACDTGLCRSIDNCVSLFHGVANPPDRPSVSMLDVITGKDDGEVFICLNNLIYRSTDYGDSWKVYAKVGISGTIKRFGGSVQVVAGSIQETPTNLGGPFGVFVDQGGGTYHSITLPTGVHDVDFIYVNGNEMFINAVPNTSYYTQDYTDPTKWVNTTGGQLVGVVAGADPGTYFLAFKLTFGFWNNGSLISKLTALGGGIVNMNDMIGEGGMDGVLVVAGAGGTLLKCIDASATRVTWSAQVIFGDWPVGNNPLRLLSVMVPQLAPMADLYTIT